MTLLWDVMRVYLRQAVGLQMVLLWANAKVVVVRGGRALLKREASVDAIASHTRTTETHQVVVVRETRIQRKPQSIQGKLLRASILQMGIWARTTLRTVESNVVSHIEVVEQLLLRKWSISMMTMGKAS